VQGNHRDAHSSNPSHSRLTPSSCEELTDIALELTVWHDFIFVEAARQLMQAWARWGNDSNCHLLSKSMRFRKTQDYLV
jgi:hypothetical protein